MVAPVVPYVIRSRSGGHITVDPRVGYLTNAKRNSELGELMTKASRVINSVETIEQQVIARRYAGLVIRRVKEFGFRPYEEAMYVRALERELKTKYIEIIERELV